MVVGDGLGTPALRLRFLACRYLLCMEFSPFGVGLMAVYVLITVSDKHRFMVHDEETNITRPELLSYYLA